MAVLLSNMDLWKREERKFREEISNQRRRMRIRIQKRKLLQEIEGMSCLGKRNEQLDNYLIRILFWLNIFVFFPPWIYRAFDSPISHVLFWISDIIQNKTHIKKNITMFTKAIGWNSPTRHVNSDKDVTVDRDSARGSVIGTRPSAEQSKMTWNPKKTIGTATECMRIAFTMFFRPK